MSQPFSTLPATARIPPKPFTVAIPKEKLADMETLIRLSKLAPDTYENSQSDMRYGVTTSWLVSMRDQWLKSYNW
jgi:microsomal epoxide hydrolase